MFQYCIIALLLEPRHGLVQRCILLDALSQCVAAVCRSYYTRYQEHSTFAAKSYVDGDPTSVLRHLELSRIYRTISNSPIMYQDLRLFHYLLQLPDYHRGAGHDLPLEPMPTWLHDIQPIYGGNAVPSIVAAMVRNQGTYDELVPPSEKVEEHYRQHGRELPRVTKRRRAPFWQDQIFLGKTTYDRVCPSIRPFDKRVLPCDRVFGNPNAIMDRHNQHDEDAFDSTFQAYKRRRGF